MANRYWVGGTAAWDATAGTKWALTDGGAGGQTVPTAADDVYFTAASGAVTVTISSGNTGAKSINCTGFTGTLAGSTAITVAGSITLVAAMGFTNTSPITLTGTGTLTTAGKLLNNLDVNGTGITVGLGDAISATQIGVTQGTFNTNNYTVTCRSGDFFSSNTNIRTINFGSSTINFIGGSSGIGFQTTTNLTFNAGTSTILLGATSTQIRAATTGGSGVVFYNVSCPLTSATNHDILGPNTYNSINVTAPSTAGVKSISFSSPVTINGTLSTTSTAGNRRVWFRGVTYGLAQTLTINSAPSLTDADFRDLYVVGTAAPISGTRIGDLRGCSGITFSTPKTVYWTTATNSTFSGNNWATTIGGAASTDNFPLAQDTATFTNTGLNVSATASLDGVIPYIGSVNMSARTNAMTLNITAVTTVYGNWTNGSGTTIFNTGALTFSGQNTQTITSAGKTFSGGITVDSYGGTVELADAFSVGSTAITVTNGTFNTKGYAITAGSLVSNNTNVRTINLGASTVTLGAFGAINFSGLDTFTLNAGTSTIIASSSDPAITVGSPGVTFYNVSFTTTSTTSSRNLSGLGQNTFNNLTIAAPSTAWVSPFSFSANQTINGTLTVAGATAVRRIFLRSDNLGTQRDLTVGTLVATDCDFRDIDILGAAAGSTPTRAGDCGGNAGITFPTPKTVYWNLAGAQNWSATGWAASSGGTPDINNFPLAQDTAVFDNTGSVTGAIEFDAGWNIGTFNASARTSAMTLNPSTIATTVYGNWLFGTGVTASSTTGSITFAGRGTKTITSNGVGFSTPITINGVTGTVQLADAFTLSSNRTLTLTSGTFDAVSYNVTVGSFTDSGSALKTLKMGSGTWTLSGIGSIWTINGTTNFNFYKGTANILLSDTSTSTRTFSGNGLSYNKLTIGGTTGTSTTNISNNNQFTELASTKTVAHTIGLQSNFQTFGAWTVTGTVGNVVTVTGTSTNHVIAGARVSGVDYLAMGTIGFAATSPGEFYAGANSTGSSATIIKTAAPAPVTRYWVGGTGTWDATTTTKWSASSGGAGGASVPTSADAVVFDALSNATAYTVTCTATQLRCGSLTMAGPASGNITWAGTAPLAIHDNVSLAATGITRSYTGAITLTSSSTGKTLTTNGVALSSAITVNGVGCEWSLGSALNNGSSNLTVTNGSIDFATYNFTAGNLSSNNTNSRTINFSTGTTVFSGASTIDFGTTESTRANLTVTASSSQINLSNSSAAFSGNNQTFYNIAFTSTAANTVTLNGSNVFNDLSFTGLTSVGLKNISVTANQTVNGTLTLFAGTNATMRHFVRSDAIGTTRTLTCAAVSATDVDFRDIAIDGAAAPVSGTRLGDCKGNSGITFDAAKTVYRRGGGNDAWSDANSWSLTNGGTGSSIYFPLAQDTAVFQTYPGTGTSVTIQFSYNIGTLDMSARTTNTMTLATGSTAPFIYGNWINGTGTTLTGTGTMTFAGRGSQTITSAGKTFTQPIAIYTPNGSVTLQDALNLTQGGNQTLFLNAGTFNANGYSVTSNGGYSASGIFVRTMAFGSGTWTTVFAGGSAFNFGTSTNLTVTGTGTISLTSSSAKTFTGGGISYSGITLNQGGAGTLTISGNNTFGNITNTYAATGATTIDLGTTTQRVGAFSASGEAGRVLTVTGSSASSPATLIFTGSGQATTPTTDYLAITGVRAYSLTDTWYAGANSTNNGSLGWLFAAATAAVVSAAGRFFLFFN